jgi:predicted enzyme related to lactoylglutathione lyase
VKVERAMHVIAVRNLDRSAAFYRDVLGFEVHEMGDPGWRVFSRDVCRIMAGECADAMAAAEIGDHSYFAFSWWMTWTRCIGGLTGRGRGRRRCESGDVPRNGS